MAFQNYQYTFHHGLVRQQDTMRERTSNCNKFFFHPEIQTHWNLEPGATSRLELPSGVLPIPRSAVILPLNERITAEENRCPSCQMVTGPPIFGRQPIRTDYVVIVLAPETVYRALTGYHLTTLLASRSRSGPSTFPAAGRRRLLSRVCPRVVFSYYLWIICERRMISSPRVSFWFLKSRSVTVLSRRWIWNNLRVLVRVPTRWCCVCVNESPHWPRCFDESARRIYSAIIMVRILTLQIIDTHYNGSHRITITYSRQFGFRNENENVFVVITSCLYGGSRQHRQLVRSLSCQFLDYW